MIKPVLIKIAVTIIQLIGPNSVTTGDVRTIAKSASYPFEQAGFELQVKRIIKKRDPFPKLHTLMFTIDRYTSLRFWAYIHGYAKTDRVYLIAPPIVDNGQHYLEGLSNVVCKHPAFAIGNAEEYSDLPGNPSRLFDDAVIMAHELAHTMSLPDSNVPSYDLMFAGLGSFGFLTDGNWPLFSQDEVNKMNYCWKHQKTGDLIYSN